MPPADLTARRWLVMGTQHRADRPASMCPIQQMLVSLIRSSGVTQASLAAATGISEKHMSYLMTGRAEGSLSLWSALLEAGGVHLPEPISRPGNSALSGGPS